MESGNLDMHLLRLFMHPMKNVLSLFFHEMFRFGGSIHIHSQKWRSNTSSFNIPEDDYGDNPQINIPEWFYLLEAHKF